MGRHRVRWTDIVGIFGFVALLVWTPMYMAGAPAADVASEHVVLPPPRDGMRLETVVFVELANGDRFEIGPWVDVAFDADSADGRAWTATITRHPAALQVGDLFFEQAAAVETIRFSEGRPQDAWHDRDQNVSGVDGDPNGTLYVRAAMRGDARAHELASARFTELTVARDVAEAFVQVATRVPNFDPGDGKAQAAASSVSGRTVRFGDEVVYAANGGDLRRIGSELGGLFTEQSKAGAICTMPLREPWTVLHEEGSIRWGGARFDEGCQQYQWDWYAEQWPAPVGFHRETRDANGDLVFQLDVVPRLIEPGDGPELLVDRASDDDRDVPSWPEQVPLGDSLTAPVRWAQAWNGTGLVAALRAEGSLDAAALDGVVALGGIAWLDRAVATERFGAPAACTWAAGVPLMFWADLVHTNGSVLQVAFDAAPDGSVGDGVRARWAEEQYTGPADETPVVDWWTEAAAVQDEAHRQGATAWLGAFGTALPARALAWDDEDACLDLDYGPLLALLPPDGVPSLHLAAFVEDPDGGTTHVVSEGARWPVETVYVPPAEARSAAAAEGPFAVASGLAPATAGPARPVEVVDQVGPSLGAAGAAALFVGLGARLFAALRGGGWIPLGALFVRGGDLSRRDAIAAFVAAHPGVTLSEVADGLDLGWGAMLHHVEALRKAGRIVRVADGARVHLFAVDGQAAPASEAERWRHIVARRARYADVWNALDSRSGATATDLARSVGRHRTSVSRTLDRLREVGLVEAQRDGRRVRFQKVA